MNKSTIITAGATVLAIMLVQNFTATQSKLVQGLAATAGAALVIGYVAPKLVKV